ncbi:hypothetical protein ACFE04_014566 [Oxalis oulophora]
MAANAAAISSSFSPSINTIQCNRSKLHCSPLLPFPSSAGRMLASSLSHFHVIEPLLGPTSAQKWRVLKMSAAVAQEETAVAAEESVVEEVETQAAEEEVVETTAEAETESTESEAEAEAESEVNTKLYFGNLPYNVDSAMLAGIIQEYGVPEMVELVADFITLGSGRATWHSQRRSIICLILLDQLLQISWDLVLYNRETGKSRGFAFVTMSSVEDCNKVIENLDGSQYVGRILRVNFADKPKPRTPLYPETEFKLFVGNLSWSVTSESLTQAFQEYGNVVGARVIFDGETGRSRGYGFVSYSSQAELEAALASTNEMELEGRSLRVTLAEGKK